MPQTPEVYRVLVETIHRFVLQSWSLDLLSRSENPDFPSGIPHQEYSVSAATIVPSMMEPVPIRASVSPLRDVLG